jgi:hypothetical protein
MVYLLLEELDPLKFGAADPVQGAVEYNFNNISEL